MSSGKTVTAGERTKERTNAMEDSTSLSAKWKKMNAYERKLAGRKRRRPEEHERRRANLLERRQKDGEEPVRMNNQKTERLQNAFNTPPSAIINICVDLRYSSSMTAKEEGRLVSQLGRMWGALKSCQPNPPRVLLSSFPESSPIHAECQRRLNGFDSWLWAKTELCPAEYYSCQQTFTNNSHSSEEKAAPKSDAIDDSETAVRYDSEVMDERVQSIGKDAIYSTKLTNKLAVKEIIVLSPDANEPLMNLGPGKVYVINGLVDETVQSGVSLSTNQHLSSSEKGSETATVPISFKRLPISEYFQRRSGGGKGSNDSESIVGTGKSILTVNQVFQCLLDVSVALKTMPDALNDVIPDRCGFELKNKLSSDVGFNEEEEEEEPS